MDFPPYQNIPPMHSNLELREGDLTSSVAPPLATAGVTQLTGVVRYSIFRARANRDVTRVQTRCRGTAAGATPTLCRVALCSVDFDPVTGLPVYSRLAQTVNDPAMWAATFTTYDRSLQGTTRLIAGLWYATASLCVTAAAEPVLYGQGGGLVVSFPQSGNGQSQTGQTDIPASYSPSTVPDASVGAPWAGLY